MQCRRPQSKHRPTLHCHLRVAKSYCKAQQSLHPSGSRGISFPTIVSRSERSLVQLFDEVGSQALISSLVMFSPPFRFCKFLN